VILTTEEAAAVAAGIGSAMPENARQKERPAARVARNLCPFRFTLRPA
jgi:hypothetical protein